MIRLVNRTRRMLTFVLAHAYYCGEGPCSCTPTTLYNRVKRPDGGEGMQQVRRHTPAVLTLPGGSTVDASERVLRVPEVQVSVEKGELSVECHLAAAPQGAVPKGLPATARLRPGPALPDRAPSGKRGRKEK